VEEVHIVADRGEAQAAPVPLGGDYWHGQTDSPLWGVADLHAHLVAHLGFGGMAFWGKPYDPDLSGDEAMAKALPDCAPAHGDFVDVNMEFGHPAGGGYPDFSIWPRFTTLVHQQAYVDWLYRAYQGGLRLTCCLAVNNELLASKSERTLPYDDRSAVMLQLAGMKEFVAHVDSRCGGPGKGWMQIAYTPDDARRIITENKLAIVLGVEVDSLGNWRRLEDLDLLSQSSVDEARRLICAELDWLHDLGVRQITPVHLSDNAFGGTAIFHRFLDCLNMFLTGRHYEVEEGWETGIRYRLDLDAADPVDTAQRAVALSGHWMAPQRTTKGRSLIHHLPGFNAMAEAATAPDIGRGQVNVRGLTPFGAILIEEMMRRGMVIDIDHMSQKATDQALTFAEAADYPVISSHAAFRDLFFSADVDYDPQDHPAYGTCNVHKIAGEGGKSADHVRRMAKLGGMVAPILNQGDIAGLRRAAPELADKVPNPCAGSSTSWAQAYLYAVKLMGGRGVALGSDINGGAALPGPRFGTYSAYGACDDACRMSGRRTQIESQTAGVRYDTPLSDYRWFRYDDSGPGAYDEQEQEIWAAIAEYRAGFNPWVDEHPGDDFPKPSLRHALKAYFERVQTKRVDEIARGFWAAEEDLEAERRGDEPAWADTTQWSTTDRAAYLFRKGQPPGPEDDDEIRVFHGKIAGVWAKWEEMVGPNPPLVRCKAGPRRDFDVNLDGMAHYGMLPDFLQDLKNIGLSREDLAPLFRSAADFVDTWEKCRQRGLQLEAVGEAQAAG